MKSGDRPDTRRMLGIEFFQAGDFVTEPVS